MVDDLDPDGARDGSDPSDLVGRLGSEVGANFFFISVNHTTDTMVELFRGAHGPSGRDFKQYTLGDDVAGFFDTMVDAVERSVSEQIEAAGADLTDTECQALLHGNMALDARTPPWSMLQQRYWVRYVNRRCQLLRSSEKFNTNQRFEGFGSTTMTVMLEEVERALNDDQRQDWGASAHQQLVYWKDGEDVRWNLLSTRPEAIEIERAEQLRSLEMRVPTEEDLRDPKVLETYLALGLGVDVEDREQRAGFDMQLGRLAAIAEHKFVLTLDFAMKMLCMHERIACRVPCTMEGETVRCTPAAVCHYAPARAPASVNVPWLISPACLLPQGVSKTALTRMLFTLKNSHAMGTRGVGSEADGRVPLREMTVRARAEETQSHGDELPGVVLRAVQEIAAERFGLKGADAPGRDAASADAQPMQFVRSPQHRPTGSAGSSSDAPPAQLRVGDGDAATIAQDVGFGVWSDGNRLVAYLLSGDCERRHELWHDVLEDVVLDPGLDVDPDRLSELFRNVGGSGLAATDLIDEANSDLLGAFLLEHVRAVLQRTAQGQAMLDWTFFQLNVDAALTASDIIARLWPQLQRATRLQRLGQLLKSSNHKEVALCLFLDEFNSSSCMGVFKELIIDHSLNGVDLPSNVVVISACNPARDRLAHFTGANARREELGKDWAMGHYQVHPLPLSMEMVKWDFGALTPLQEKEFIDKRMRTLYPDSDDFPYVEQRELTTMVARSQELTRQFAAEHIAARPSVASQTTGAGLSAGARRAIMTELRPIIERLLPSHLTWAQVQPIAERLIATEDDVRAARFAPPDFAARLVDVAARASSAVSLRDIQRVFSLFGFFHDILLCRKGEQPGEASTPTNAPLLFNDGRHDVEPAHDRRRRDTAHHLRGLLFAA